MYNINMHKFFFTALCKVHKMEAPALEGLRRRPGQHAVHKKAAILIGGLNKVYTFYLFLQMMKIVKFAIAKILQRIIQPVISFTSLS